MDLQKRKLDRILREQAAFIGSLPAATKAAFDCDKHEYYKTFEMYEKQEQAITAGGDITQGTQNLIFLESKGDKLFQQLMSYFPQDQTRGQPLIVDKAARPGSVSIRPVKKGTY